MGEDEVSTQETAEDETGVLPEGMAEGMTDTSLQDSMPEE